MVCPVTMVYAKLYNNLSSFTNFDAVINYEVVLSNGTIVNANAQSHSDLFFALKGGGNQFGTLQFP
jgi:hypothetical protein